MPTTRRKGPAARLRPLAVTFIVLTAFGTIAKAESAPPAPQVMVAATHLQLWRSVEIGTLRGVRGYREALDAVRVRIGDSADEIIGRPAFPYAKTQSVVGLVIMSVAELGFGSARAPLAAIYRRGVELGLDLCPPEAALQLRLDYTDQPLGESLHVAMAPIKAYGGQPTILALANFGSGALLVGSNGDPDFLAPPEWRFVFAWAGPKQSHEADTVALDRR